MELMTPEGAKGYLRESRSEKEWNSRLDEVRAANGGYPSWWYSEIVASGFVQEVARNWGGDAQIHVSPLSA